MMAPAASSSPESDQSRLSTPAGQDIPIRAHKRRRETLTAEDHSTSRRRMSPPAHASYELQDYDPDVPAEVRRRLQAGFKSLQAEAESRKHELVKPQAEGIGQLLENSGMLYDQVKQPADAKKDSSVFGVVGQIVLTKTQNLLKGSLSQGLDIETFTSKSLTFMRQMDKDYSTNTLQISSTQQLRRRAGQEEDFVEADDMIDWARFGYLGILPEILRVAVPELLIGPLSAEKKVRKVSHRTARFRPSELKQVKPQLISKDDLGRSETNDLASACVSILTRLEEYVQSCQDRLNAMIGGPNGSPEAIAAAMDELGVHEAGDIDLLKFAINPRSFGQSVENLFYISFLIRDRRISVDFDRQGFASIFPCDREEDDENVPEGDRGVRRQAVFTLDMKLWKEAIDAFDIQEPLIPHRVETSNHAPGANGWYG